jgi:retron-type reverse transcriptase
MIQDNEVFFLIKTNIAGLKRGGLINQSIARIF